MAKTDAERAQAYRQRNRVTADQVQAFLLAFADAQERAGQPRLVDDLFDLAPGEALDLLRTRIEGKRVIVAGSSSSGSEKRPGSKKV